MRNLSFRQERRVAFGRLGALIPLNFYARIDTCIGTMYTGSWLKAGDYGLPEIVSDRSHVFDAVARTLESRPTAYLEFGVHKGKSLQMWTKLLAGPDSVLFGFDSFAGLPSRWNYLNPAGTFDVHGQLPDISDARVTLIPGWFENTVLKFDFDGLRNHQWVVNIDCDLYSSTVTVLEAIEPHLVPGTIIYFDEFSDRHHELPAFHEHTVRTGFRYSPVAATPGYTQIAFRLDGVG